MLGCRKCASWLNYPCGPGTKCTYTWADPVDGLPLWIQVLSGVGGIVLVVGMALMGISYLEEGTWSSFTDTPAQVTMIGVLILGGVAVRNAIRSDRGDN